MFILYQLGCYLAKNKSIYIITQTKMIKHASVPVRSKLVRCFRILFYLYDLHECSNEGNSHQ